MKLCVKLEKLSVMSAVMFWTQGGQVLVWLTWLWIRGCSGFAWSCPQGGSQWCRGGCLWHRTSIWRLSYNKIQYNCHRDFKQIFKYIDSKTNIINLIIIQSMVKLNKHLLEHRDWVTEISSMAMSPCNPFPRIPSMTNYSKKKFCF